MAQDANNVRLNGLYHHKVDAKGRLSLPASFRKVLPTDLIVTIDPFDECLRVYVPEAFNRWVDKVFEDKFGGYDDTDRTHVYLRSLLRERANDVTIDAAGRIMLPAELRGSVGIEKDVDLTGNDGYFEIWDAKRHEDNRMDIDLSVLFPGRKA